MPDKRRFVIDLAADDQELIDKFRTFVLKTGLDEGSARAAVENFKAVIVPHLEGLREVVSHGANIDFSRTLDTKAGEISIEVSSARPGLFKRFLKFFKG